jgi:D-alanyl-D-alanine carboxypeptidase (penicillin-binding protein 5/6)
VKKLICFILSFIILGCSVYAAPVETVHAPTYLLADINTGTVLARENCTVNISPGDFSKIMTGILAIEKFAPEDFLSFKQEQLSFYHSYGNIAGAKKGYKMTVLDHLNNMLLLYSDASATELAIAHSGTEADFVDVMNEKAKEIGMTDTVFVSPHGYDAEGKGTTTVDDLFILAKYVYKNELFKSVVSAELFYLPPLKEGGNDRKFSSRNHLISRYTYSTHTYSAANGMLHSINKDSTSMIATAYKKGADLVAIIIGSPDNKSLTVYRDAINLFEFGFNKHTYRTICTKGEGLHQVQAVGASDQVAVLVADNSYKALLPVSYDADKLTVETEAPEVLKAPLKQGETIGRAVYKYDGEFVMSVPLAVSKDISFNLFAYIGSKLFSKINTFLLFILIIVALFFIIISYNSAKKKAERRKRAKEIMKNIKK